MLSNKQAKNGVLEGQMWVGLMSIVPLYRSMDNTRVPSSKVPKRHSRSCVQKTGTVRDRTGSQKEIGIGISHLGLCEVAIFFLLQKISKTTIYNLHI